MLSHLPLLIHLLFHLPPKRLQCLEFYLHFQCFHSGFLFTNWTFAFQEVGGNACIVNGASETKKKQPRIYPQNTQIGL